MNINKFDDLNLLNDYLNKTKSNLENKYNSSLIDNISSVLQDNTTLFVEGNGEARQLNERLRFIKIVADLKKISENANEKKYSSQLKKVMKIAARAFVLRSTSYSNFLTILEIESLKKIDETLYYQTLGDWISEEKIPIKEFELKEEVLLKCAPWLTYLNLKDKSDISQRKFSEQFIGKLLSKTKKLNHLAIENSDITGECINELKNTENIKNIEIRNCKNFNNKLPKNLPNLKTLVFSNCNTFNRGLPKTLLNLEKLVFFKCKAFNQKLPECLSKLNVLYIENCDSFNQKLPSNLLNLKLLFIAACEKYNEKLPNLLPKLKELEMYGCPLFNQQIPNISSLETLKLLHCGSFNQPLSEGLPNLKSLRLLHCGSFNQPLSEGLSNLESLHLHFCREFNNTLPNNPRKLKYFAMNCLRDFKPFAQPLNTLLFLHKFNPRLLEETWQKLSSEEKEQQRIALLSQKNAISQVTNLRKIRPF